jgi:uncharacterized Zn finger protein (UPF0148 family)
MFPSTLQSGVWYIAAVCPRCKKLVPLFRDLNQGTSKFQTAYEITCPVCHRKGIFEGQHYKHSQPGSNPP